jgi:hypothetical protein
LRPEIAGRAASPYPPFHGADRVAPAARDLDRDPGRCPGAEPGSPAGQPVIREQHDAEARQLRPRLGATASSAAEPRVGREPPRDCGPGKWGDSYFTQRSTVRKLCGVGLRGTSPFAARVPPTRGRWNGARPARTRWSAGPSSAGYCSSPGARGAEHDPLGRAQYRRLAGVRAPWSGPASGHTNSVDLYAEISRWP